MIRVRPNHGRPAIAFDGQRCIGTFCNRTCPRRPPPHATPRGFCTHRACCSARGTSNGVRYGEARVGERHAARVLHTPRMLQRARHVERGAARFDHTQ